MGTWKKTITKFISFRLLLLNTHPDLHSSYRTTKVSRMQHQLNYFLKNTKPWRQLEETSMSPKVHRCQQNQRCCIPRTNLSNGVTRTSYLLSPTLSPFPPPVTVDTTILPAHWGLHPSITLFSSLLPPQSICFTTALPRLAPSFPTLPKGAWSGVRNVLAFRWTAQRKCRWDKGKQVIKVQLSTSFLLFNYLNAIFLCQSLCQINTAACTLLSPSHTTPHTHQSHFSPLAYFTFCIPHK